MTTTTTALATAGKMVGDSYFFPRESPAEVSTVSRCSTTYAPNPPTWGPSTDYYTSTSYVYRNKFELLTPKPSTTSVSATSTYTQYETAPNNLTHTVWTDTYTYTNYMTTTETVSSTATVTTSVTLTTTVPTSAGFTAVAADHPEATQHLDDSADGDHWSVEDSYWQDDWALQQEPDAPEPSPSALASKIDCLITILNFLESSTTSSKSYAPPPTYTRTKYVATETSTITVTTKLSPTETPVTYSMASGLETQSWLTETQTDVQTVRLALPAPPQLLQGGKKKANLTYFLP
jgi:hypothetical protein